MLRPKGKQEWTDPTCWSPWGVSRYQGLNLPAAGVETTTNGFIKVNDRLETNVSGIWAIGDVSGGPQFTHASSTIFEFFEITFLGMVPIQE
jgi:pyruvate/2-oxoglutarate dehydrogenase complex dihydrolipoamide dehydrogenase (E3) component